MTRNERERLAGKARVAVQRAVASGAVVRGRCAMETSEHPCRGKSHAHHEDYSRPLDVVWLCAFHHHGLHADRRRVTASATAIERRILRERMASLDWMTHALREAENAADAVVAQLISLGLTHDEAEAQLVGALLRVEWPANEVAA